MCEIGDFSAFERPKQLFAYFGLGPVVKQSGNFTGAKLKMSKRGSALAMRAIHTIAPISVGKSKKGGTTAYYWLIIRKNARRNRRG
jgi:transposase